MLSDAGLRSAKSRVHLRAGGYIKLCDSKFLFGFRPSFEPNNTPIYIGFWRMHSHYKLLPWLADRGGLHGPAFELAADMKASSTTHSTNYSQSRNQFPRFLICRDYLINLLNREAPFRFPTSKRSDTCSSV